MDVEAELRCCPQPRQTPRRQARERDAPPPPDRRHQRPPDHPRRRRAPRSGAPVRRAVGAFKTFARSLSGGSKRDYTRARDGRRRQGAPQQSSSGCSTTGGVPCSWKSSATSAAPPPWSSPRAALTTDSAAELLQASINPRVRYSPTVLTLIVQFVASTARVALVWRYVRGFASLISTVAEEACRSHSERHETLTALDGVAGAEVVQAHRDREIEALRMRRRAP